MVKKISRSKVRTRKVRMKIFLRWVIYSLLLVFLYACEAAPLIKGWCPLLIIPLATSVAMKEGELSSGIFGVVCGLMLDVASGVSGAGDNILGFSSLWLLICCPAISLLIQFWVKSGWISHLVLNAAVVVIMCAMDFLFMHWVWEQEFSGISFVKSLLPAYSWAIILSTPIYFLVCFVSNKLRPKEERRLEEAAEDSAAEEEITKGEA